MKNLFAALALVALPFSYSHAASSQTAKPVTQAVGYANVALVDQEPLCPAGAECVVGGTDVTVSVTYGCGQSGQPLAYKALEVGDELHVFVAAPYIYNPSSHIECFAIIPVKRTLALPGLFGKVVVHSMGTFDTDANER